MQHDLAAIVTSRRGPTCRVSSAAWIFLAAAGLLATPRARAAELEWNAPAGCTSDAFLQQLQDTTEQPLSELELTSLVVSVTTSGARAWRVAFSLGDADGQQSPSRTIAGSSCEDVSRAAAVAAAMAIHSLEAAAPESPKGEASSLQADGVVEPTVVAATPPADDSVHAPPASNTKTPLHFPLQLIALGDVSMLGAASYALGLGVGIAGERWEVDVAGVVFPGVDRALESDIALDVSAYLALASACWSFGESLVRTRACLGYEIGLVSAEGAGTGLAVGRREDALWHAVRPEVGLGVPLSPGLELRLSAGVAIGLSRAQFVIDDGRVGHELPRISPRGAIVLTWIP